MIRLLATTAPITIVIGRTNVRLRSIAKRIAHDVYVYHRTDCEIVTDEEALRRVAAGTLSEGSLVVLGGPFENRYAEWMVGQKRIPCELGLVSEWHEADYQCRSRRKGSWSSKIV
jgi:hypothetical protein